MTLIQAYKNRYVQALVQVINQLCQGASLSKGKLSGAIQEAAAMPPHAAFGEAFLEAVRCDDGLLLDLTDPIQVRPVRPTPIPQMLSGPERIYLRTILESPYMPLFLDPPEIQSLRETLDEAGVADYSPYLTTIRQMGGDEITPDYVQKFRQIQQAIQERRYLGYHNHTPKGVLTDRISLPLRIEFSAMDAVFRVAMWTPADGGRVIKANIGRLSHLSFSTTCPPLPTQTIQELLQDKRAPEPIVARIRDRKNAPERAAVLFSMYDAALRPLEGGDWEMRLWYYTFDQQTIYRQILSFGPSIQVLSPAWLVADIHTYLSQT